MLLLIVIVKLHRLLKMHNVAYCDQRSCRVVCQSVCHAIMSEQIKVLFRVETIAGVG